MQALNFGFFRRTLTVAGALLRGRAPQINSPAASKLAEPITLASRPRVRPKNKRQVRKLRHGRDSRGMGIVRKLG